TVGRLLGQGAVGIVYEARIGEKCYALKWLISRGNAGVEQKLIAMIRQGEPDSRFLWPIAMAYSTRCAGFGYLMPLVGDGFLNIIQWLKRRVDMSSALIGTVGLNLAEAFLHLHMRGLCYVDVSFGNLFFHPNSGDILLSDVDSICACGISANHVFS